MKIGEIVKGYIPKIFNYCEENPAELPRLMSKEYTKRQFGINFPFCQEPAKIMLAGKDERYWADEYRVCGEIVRVCSQWQKRQPQVWAGFASYIAERGIIGEQEKDDIIAAGLEAAKEYPAHKQGGHGYKKSSGKGRYWVTAVGDVQNSFVRHILGSLGDESFSENDWEQTKEYFGGKCAYCGKDAKLQRDHVVPINKKSMGEHRLGNLVPSCRSCNNDKGRKDYRQWDFLVNNPAARERIEEYMRSRNYLPIKGEDVEKARKILEDARSKIKPLAEKCIAEINDLLGKED